MGRGKLRIAVTADLHWGIARGMVANQAMANYLFENPPDVLIFAGDIGHDHFFEECLKTFENLNCTKALVPGNHDIWVASDDSRGSSWDVYSEVLPRISARHGFHYLDHGPLHLPDWGLSILGNINWYDYSWSEQKILDRFPGEEGRLATKKFTRGQHNDFNYVRWQLDDRSFTKLVVEEMRMQLENASRSGNRSVVVTHHPAIRPLAFPQLDQDFSLDALIWEALSGNSLLEQVLFQNKHHVGHIFSGHTHRARVEDWHGVKGYNVGSDYHFKRLLEFSWPDGEINPIEFHG